METRRRNSLPNSSKFPFSLQLGLRVLKEFAANVYQCLPASLMKIKEILFKLGNTERHYITKSLAYM
jgi:hypothetical protein